MNNYDLAVLIPARNEAFLSKTVEGVLANKRGETQVIVVLDGQWADPPITDHDDLTVVYLPESIGQRAATNLACRLTKAKYVMKLDAHCILDVGFDIKLMEAMQGHDDWTIVPLMRNLHAFDWVCQKCGSRQYQGPSEKYEQCDKCDGKRVKEIIWIAKESPRSTSFCFDPEPHFQYFNEFRHRPEGKGNITETMSLQGSCFMLTRHKYWELDICNEEFGSWGSQGIEVAVKTWLSGGKVMCLQTTFYAHLFRTQGGDFGFPYSLSGNQVQRAKKRAKELFFENKWEGQIRPLSWLLEKFWPVPKWTEEDLARLKEFDSRFTSIVGVKTLLPVAGSADTMPNDTGASEGMTSLAENFPSVNGSKGITTGEVLRMKDEVQMQGIAAPNVIADMIDNGDIPINPSTLMTGNGSNQPSINKAMDGVVKSINSNYPVSPLIGTASPIPTTSNLVDIDLREQSNNVDRSKISDGKHVAHELSKNIIFYTDCQLNIKIAHKVQDQLRKMGLPIVSASLKPMPHFGNNIHLPLKRGVDAYFQQIITALENSKADIVYMCEHDVLYHPSHFDFIPPTKDKFYYNQNFWRIRPEVDSLAVHWDANQVSGLVAYREPLLAWYKQKWEKIQKEGFDRSYEPGGRNSEQIVTFKSAYPNVDIRHGGNLTKSKWSIADFRDKSTCINWQETTAGKIPGWEGFPLAFV